MSPMNKDHDVKSKLVSQGVRKLKLLGFINVDEQNIVEDDVYRFYFIRILNSNLGENTEMDLAICELIAELKKKPQRP